MSNVLEIFGSELSSKPEITTVTASLTEGFDDYFSRLYAYAIYRLQDPVIADEIVSMTFAAALSRSDQFDPTIGSMDAWLFGIARNVIRKHLRTRRIRVLISLDSFSSHPGSSQRWVEDVAAENQLLAELLSRVGNLPEREREILSLKFGAEMTNRDIAEIMGLTQSNVGVILYRTLRHLRDQMHEGAGDE